MKRDGYFGKSIFNNHLATRLKTIHCQISVINMMIYLALIRKEKILGWMTLEAEISYVSITLLSLWWGFDFNLQLKMCKSLAMRWRKKERKQYTPLQGARSIFPE